MLFTLLLFVSLAADIEDMPFNPQHVSELLDQERYDEAAEYAHQFLPSSDPNGPNLPLCLIYGIWGNGEYAMTRCETISDRQNWKEEVQCALRKKRCPIPRKTILEFHYAEALAYYRLKDPELATRSIKVAQEISPKDWRVALLAALIANEPIEGVRKLAQDQEAFDRLAVRFQTEPRDDWRTIKAFAPMILSLAVVAVWLLKKRRG